MEAGLAQSSSKGPPCMHAADVSSDRQRATAGRHHMAVTFEALPQVGGVALPQVGGVALRLKGARRARSAAKQEP